MEDNKTKTIHTYLSDMADAVRENEGSVIKIALAEQERKEREELFKKAEGSKTQKVLLTIGGILLILIASYGAYYFYQKNVEKNTPTSTSRNIETFINYDDQVFIDVSSVKGSSELLEKIKQEKSDADDSIKSIFLTVPKVETVGKEQRITKQLISSKSFLSLIESNAPVSLVNSLSSEFMLGTYSKKSEDKLGNFIIFETNDYELTYAKMLEWEKSILSNLFVLFQIDVTSDNELLTRNFKDLVIKNKDVRVLYSADGTKKLFYLFVDKSKFIITDNEETLKEIINRLIAKSTKA